MAKKEVSAIVSGMGVGMAILTSLMEKAKKRGLPEESIHRLATPQGDALLDKMVAVLTEATATVGNVFRVLVNYDLRVDAAVRECGCDWANSDINDKNFKTNRTGQKEVEMKLFHFSRLMESEEAIKEMKKEGYRPAELHEGLAFVTKNKDEQRKYPIVLLGSLWQYWSGDWSVACLRSDADERDLDLYYFDDRWYASCRFLAVRES